ncbi:choline transport protein-like protein [Patellaria atrata CBS 101060]|uniref:Choline transport protein-like protein n=1 Tax=Patellaria atrata CBS 101060 TaxID=1346257 RepID=A0A9P4SCT8_9PEZI|nr:choline transport protein-like protein [Patellaria atrata CBS 101060]
MKNQVSKEAAGGVPRYESDDTVQVGQVINASGHVQELERSFSLLSACSVGINTGNTWAAFGGAIVVSIYNGGPPGVIYELVAVSFFYWLIAACIAELASAIPSSAGVYHWASITAGPKYGRAAGWFAGWWNCLAWSFGASSLSAALANLVLAMWGLFNPSYVPQRWHTFVVYIILSWLCCSVVLFANRALPVISQLGLFFIIAGVMITVLVCAIMPHTTGSRYSSNAFVWRDFENQTGYSSDGFVFLMGMLNGAYAVGTPDCISHLAEEIAHPRVNVPKAIAAQMTIGFITGLVYLISIFYSINDFDSLISNPYTSPLAELYRQATSSRGGSLGLMIVIFLPLLSTNIGACLTASRMLWTLARDDATPFSPFVGKVSSTRKNPFNATLVYGCFSTVLACIYLGSVTAFNAFVGSFVVLSTLSYLAAILPNLLTRRRHIPKGPFYMPNKVAYTFMCISCSYIIVFVVIFCFPYAMPVTAQTMNYSCVTTGGFTLLVSIWWMWKRNKGYVGPKVLVREVVRESSSLAHMGEGKSL